MEVDYARIWRSIAHREGVMLMGGGCNGKQDGRTAGVKVIAAPAHAAQMAYYSLALPEAKAGDDQSDELDGG